MSSSRSASFRAEKRQSWKSFNVKQYIGAPIPKTKNGDLTLSWQAVFRLHALEVKNRVRTRRLGDGAIIEPVDFVGRCIEQNWLCVICKQTLDPHDYVSDRKISVEHDPALSVCREHSPRTVYAAHSRCNQEKGSKTDTTRAAKIKRVRSDEEKHAARMRMKATMTPAAYRRERLKEAFSQGPKRRILSRGFDRTKSRSFDGSVKVRQ